jgi:hypothetical protein
MRSSESDTEFLSFLAARGEELGGLGAASAVESMLDFYRSVRADDVDLADGGDMLLFQWGTYDLAEGPSFRHDITRQFITEVVDGDDADDSFWQLSLVLHFEPNNATAAVGAGDRWCRGLAEVDELRQFISDQPTSTLARRSSPTRVELVFDAAG